MNNDIGWEGVKPTQKYTVEESKLISETNRAWNEYDKYVDKTADREEIFNFSKHDSLLAAAHKADQDLLDFRRNKNANKPTNELPARL